MSPLDDFYFWVALIAIFFLLLAVLGWRQEYGFRLETERQADLLLRALGVLEEFLREDDRELLAPTLKRIK